MYDVVVNVIHIILNMPLTPSDSVLHFYRYQMGQILRANAHKNQKIVAATQNGSSPPFDFIKKKNSYEKRILSFVFGLARLGLRWHR